VTAALVAGGLVLLLGGGELLVRGAVGLARGFGVSRLVIGLTVVAFGTSAPELVVSLEAALGGHPDIVLGNVVGSNIANVLLVVGFAAVLRPIVIGSGTLRRDGAILVAATLAFIAACHLGGIDRGVGAAMVAALAAYTVWSLWAARREAAPAIAELGDEIEEAPRRPWLALAFTAAGIAGVIVGADFLIDGAVRIARFAGLSEAVIGLSLIAFGTSLPELATAAMAALRGHSDLAVGNVLGSNLFNMFAIAGITALVVPVPVPGELVAFDLWVMLGVTLALLAMLAGGRRITRIEGAALRRRRRAGLGVSGAGCHVASFGVC
jgi:cation:H+ antiporter